MPNPVHFAGFDQRNSRHLSDLISGSTALLLDHLTFFSNCWIISKGLILRTSASLNSVIKEGTEIPRSSFEMYARSTSE